MTTSAEKMRAWQGPALLAFGFRPFFLGAAVWAVIAMLAWLGVLSGHFELASHFDPVAWHAHELLFGYLAAVMAGFLLTAVPNWSGRLPIVRWPLLELFVLWIAGRIAVGFSAHMPPVAAAIADLSMPVVLAGLIGREIIAGRNLRNLVVLVLLAAFIAGNAVFHLEAASGLDAARGYGLRIGLGAAMMMIGLIGGRIIPSFTRNWLVRQKAGRLPAPPMQGFDKVALAVLLIAVAAWVAAPFAAATGWALLAAGVSHLVRLARWAGYRTGPEPLLWVLHAGYVFVPLGALALACGILWPGVLADAAGQHLWMAGAIGLMTLAVMTRATLGHTGQPLSAGAGTTAIYAAMIIAVVARFAAGVWLEEAAALHTVAGICWLGAFAGFVALYAPLLLRARTT